MRPIVSLLIAIAAASISGQNKSATALSTVSKSSSTSRIRNSSSQTLSSLMFPLLESSTVEKEKISLLPGSETSSNNLSPFLQGMVDEQRELQMNVGKAMDTLRKDYPYFLKRAPGKFCFMRVTPHTNNYSFLFVDLTEKHLNSFIFQIIPSITTTYHSKHPMVRFNSPNLPPTKKPWVWYVQPSLSFTMPIVASFKVEWYTIPHGRNFVCLIMPC